MRCRSATLTKALSILSLSSALGGCAFFKEKPPIDGYCERYNPVVQQKGDGTAVAAIPKEGPKRRIYANELIYRQHCPDEQKSSQ